MENLKLITLLRTFSKGEFRELGRFVRSPLYNRHEGVLQLFSYLRKEIEEGKGPIKKEKVMKKLFTGKAASVQDLHYLNSYLLKAIEQYMAWAEWQKEESEWGIYLLRAYQKRGLEKPFGQHLKKTVQQHQKQPLRNATYFRKKYLLEWEENSFSVVEGRGKEFTLQNLSNTLEQAFIAEKLKIACSLLSHQAVTQKDYDFGILDGVLQYVEQREFEKEPAIAVNYHSYKALTNVEEDDHFQALKSLLLENSDCFTLGELRDGHTIAINCCIKRINLGKQGFFKEIFDMYKSGLELDVFLTNGQLGPRTYGNITLSGLKLNEFDWVHEFVHAYKSKLPEHQRDSYFNYNLACYYYALGDYRKAMPLYQQIESVDLFNNLSAKTTLAKMYFELKEFDALDHLLNSFKTFIYRKKDLGYHRDNFLSMISLMQKLMALKPYAKEEKEKFRTEINSRKMSPKEKEWFLKQVDLK